jgi:hypothetical protein
MVRWWDYVLELAIYLLLFIVFVVVGSASLAMVACCIIFAIEPAKGFHFDKLIPFMSQNILFVAIVVGAGFYLAFFGKGSRK